MADYPDRAERERMVESVNRMVFSCGEGRVPRKDLEDFAQDCRLELWRQSATFDLAGKAKWATYAFALINVVACRYGAKADNTWLKGAGVPSDEFDPDRKASSTLQPDEIVANAEHDPGDVAGFDELAHAIRNQAFAEALVAISPGLRRYVSLVVLDGLDTQQVATQTGVPAKVIHRHLAKGLAQLARAGHISPDLARKAGIDVQALAEKACVAGVRKRAAVRRVKVAALAAEGLKGKQIAERLGEPWMTVCRDLKALRRPPCLRAQAMNEQQDSPSAVAV